MYQPGYPHQGVPPMIAQPPRPKPAVGRIVFVCLVLYFGVLRP